MSAGTICKCGLARDYHPLADHQYEPRYDATSWELGYQEGLAASPGARHDVPELEVERLARALTTHVSAHKTRSRSHATVACCKAIAAEYRRLSTPPVLVPRDEPTREDIEG